MAEPVTVLILVTSSGVNPCWATARDEKNRNRSEVITETNIR
jgi:hypothetical protein